MSKAERITTRKRESQQHGIEKLIKAGEYTVGATTDIQDETGQQKHGYELVERGQQSTGARDEKSECKMRKVSTS